jgi:hypothetical protein
MAHGGSELYASLHQYCNLLRLTFSKDAAPVDPDPPQVLIPFNGKGSRWLNHDVDKIHTVLNELHEDYKNNNLQRLEPIECLQEYAAAIQSNRRHLLLIANETKFPPMDQNIFISKYKKAEVHMKLSLISQPAYPRRIACILGFPFHSTAAMTTDDAASAYDWICSNRSHRDGARYSCSDEIDVIRRWPFEYLSDISES